MYKFSVVLLFFPLNHATVRVILDTSTKLKWMCICSSKTNSHTQLSTQYFSPLEVIASIYLSNHESNNGFDGTKEVHPPKSLEKKFVGLAFSAHATCMYLPSLSTCLGSPLVSFLQTLQVLSTQPSSTYSPSTAFRNKLVGQYSVA